MKVIKCKQCGVVLTGGFYNTPIGVFCSACWEKKPKKVRDKALEDSLKRFSALGKTLINDSV